VTKRPEQWLGIEGKYPRTDFSRDPSIGANRNIRLVFTITGDELFQYPLFEPVERLTTRRFGDLELVCELDERYAAWCIVVPSVDRLVEEPLLSIGE